jgi:hypothetical protein
MSVIPHSIWSAAKIIYNYTPSHTLRDELGLLVERKSDLTTENPDVKLHHTIDTGSCLIYLSEVVPLSMYLFLMLKDAHYTVQVIPNTNPLRIDFSNVYVKRWSGKEAAVKTQPFHCETIIKEQYDDEEYEKAVAYVKQLGPLNPEEVVVFSFIEFHLEGLRNYGKRIRTE